MTMRIEWSNGFYWLSIFKSEQRMIIGPFDTELKASERVVELVADRAKEISGNNVYFLEPRSK